MPEEAVTPAVHIEEASASAQILRATPSQSSIQISITQTPGVTNWPAAETATSSVSSSVSAISTPTLASPITREAAAISPSPVRPSERSVFFPNIMPTNLDEIRPIIAQAYSNPMTLTSWFNVRLPGQQSQAPRHVERSEDSYVVDIEGESAAPAAQTYDHNHTTNDNLLNNIREASTSPNNSSNNVSNNSEEQQMPDTLPMTPEARELFQAIQNHLPFVVLLIIKYIYDHRIGTLCLFILIFVFMKTNNDLKKEIAKQQNQSRRALLHILFYILGVLFIIYFAPGRTPLFYFTDPLVFWDLIWSIIVTDYILKLITIAIKTLVTSLPPSVLVFSKRGKYFLWVEAMSQFYRSTVPMYSWMNYLKNSYQWPELAFGILLMIFYAATKIREFISRWQFLQGAFVKFCQDVSLGASPSKEQLAAAGDVCVICHETYSMPVRLHCKHIFCESCVLTWLDRERTCPLCRTAITDDPVYRDGHTTHFVQLY